MIDWFKSLDVYGWFLFVVLGIPAIILAFAGLGVAGIAIVNEHGWWTIPIMLTVPSICITIGLGSVGMFTGPSPFPREWSGAKKVCIFWWTTSAIAIVGLGVPGLIVYGVMRLIS